MNIVPSTKALPHLPVELILLIIENVPADHILPFRILCRSIKTHIDTSIFTSYLQRMTIAGHVTNFGPALVAFKYSAPPGGTSSSDPSALFRVDPEWLDIFEDWEGHVPDEDFVRPVEEFTAYWFVQLDHFALELDTGVTTYDQAMGKYLHFSNEGEFDFQVATRSIRVNWRVVLWNMLVRENEIARRVCAQQACNMGNIEDADITSESKFTYRYGPLEDHIRATRREYLMRYLNRDDSLWHGLNDLERLSGQRPKPQVEGPHNQKIIGNVGRIEDSALRFIMRLRRGE